jgi:hypothetical protein
MLNSHMCSFPSIQHHFYPFFKAAGNLRHKFTFLGLTPSKMGVSGADSTEMGSAIKHCASNLHHMSVDS